MIRPSSGQEFAGCRVKAFDVYGPEPPLKEMSDPDYPACKEAAAKKISEHEFRRAPFVSDCMTAAGYTIVACSLAHQTTWMATTNFDHCYERPHLW